MAQYRFLLYDSDRQAVGVSRDRGKVGLPSIEARDGWVPDMVDELTAAATTLLGIDATVIRHVAETGSGRRTGRGEWPADVCEVIAVNGDTRRARCEWVGIDDLRERDIETEDAELITERLALGGTQPPDRAPWEVAGWRHEAESWVADTLATRGERVERQRIVKGAWPCSCVIAAETLGGKRYYFKAVNAKPPAEPVIVERLVEHFAARVPPLVAVDHERRWMITVDVGTVGSHVSEASQVLEEFARMQLALEDSTATWTALGCPPLSAEHLVEQLDALVGDLATLRSVAGATPLPAELEVESVRRQLETAALQLADASISPSLVHQDFRLSNTFATAAGPVFFDWSDCAVAHPFFSATFFLHYCRPSTVPTHVADLDHSEDGTRRTLRDAYLAPFVHRFGHDRVRSEFALVWQLAPLFQACRHHRELQYVEASSPWAMTLRGAILADWQRAATRTAGMK